MYDIAPGLRERTFDTGEVQLHLIEAGPATGNPVLLLHGFPEFWFGWRSQIAPLAQAGYRVVVPDQRGYNLSEKPAAVSAYSIQHLVGDAVAIIEEAGGAVDLIGHDWGALSPGMWRCGFRRRCGNLSFSTYLIRPPCKPRCAAVGSSACGVGTFSSSSSPGFPSACLG